MAIRTFGEAIVEFHGEQIVTNTTVSGIGAPLCAQEVMFNCAAATRVQLAPKIAMCCKTADSGVTFTNYTSQVQDRTTSTLATLTGLDTAANGDFWYLASKHKFAGCILDLVDLNATASVMSGYFWNGAAWADASITDNTATGGACLAEDGAANDSITWTPAATWATTTLNGVSGLYVIRFQVTAALDSTTIAEISLVGDTTNSPAGYFAAATDYVMTINSSEVGGISFIAAGASTANVTWIRHTRRANS